MEGVTPHLFYLSHLVCPLFSINLPTIFFLSGVTLHGGCNSGRSAPPPLSSPSDATATVDVAGFAQTYRVIGRIRERRAVSICNALTEYYIRQRELAKCHPVSYSANHASCLRFYMHE